ncbi:hypothetical protein TrRE_jg10665 [Triparma retinervis]|uniref:Uncharacterized protein n=1 Tax=Triparma retinervis TaxID=2557542 RepID=A0A9W6ZB85_9STRA|nr:hypothetical protein TrRE_jg10665 [Triparma retinervis]
MHAGDQILSEDRPRLLASNATDLEPFGLIKYWRLLEHNPWLFVLFLILFLAVGCIVMNIERLQKKKEELRLRWWMFKERMRAVKRTWKETGRRGGDEEAATSPMALEATTRV